jgi:hypothetical protein
MLKAASITGLSVLLFFSTLGVTFAQNEESFVRAATVSKGEAIVLSVLFPGLGQMTVGQKVKGVTFFLAGVASLAVFVNSNENYLTKLDTYNRDKTVLYSKARQGRATYDGPASYDGQGGAFQMFNDLKSQNNSLDNLNSTRNTALIVAAAVYAYNIFDAVFFTPSSNESKKAEIRKNIIVESALVDMKPGILVSTRF